MSVLLRPEKVDPGVPLLTIASGLAVARAVESIAKVKLGLKWVNDLIFDGRKVGGILAEFQHQAKVPQPVEHMHHDKALETSSPPRLNKDHTRESGCPPHSNQVLVIGIGINICSDNVQLPPELVGKIHWLEEITQHPIDRNLLVAQIANELEQVIALALAGNITPILDGWRSYSATLGEQVKASIGSNTIEGLALDITDSGALIVQTSSGIKKLHAGEVSIRKPDGSY
jgi:BirA family biotin operon repressor/biotin-[acetyl-CoA-carboxylase] ligase